MVLFDNINVNQRVELLLEGHILQGTVRYKGGLNGVIGDWVGIALDKGLGRNDGMIDGRRYFQCRPGHGIFMTADKIRFIPMKRGSFNKYRPVNKNSKADEALFRSYSRMMIQDRDPNDSTGWVTESYHKDARRSFPNAHLDDGVGNFHLTHSVGNHIPAQTMLRPQTCQVRFTYTSEPIYYTYSNDDFLYEPFISSPSIPKTHMPHSALKRQVERGWDESHYVREMTDHRGRDSIKCCSWNDVSL